MVLRDPACSLQVLVVEDDPMVAQVITDILSSNGFDVVSAVDGTEALSIFERIGMQICCVILDFDIPGLHSSRVFNRLREINSEVRILLSSGYPESEIVEGAHFMGIDGFIPKPYDPRVLLAQLPLSNK